MIIGTEVWLGTEIHVRFPSHKAKTLNHPSLYTIEEWLFSLGLMMTISHHEAEIAWALDNDRKGKNDVVTATSMTMKTGYKHFSAGKEGRAIGGSSGIPPIKFSCLPAAPGPGTVREDECVRGGGDPKQHWWSFLQAVTYPGRSLKGVGSDRNRRDQDRGRQGENTETDSWVLGVSQGQEP